jgi:hypothetical protein
MDNFSYVKVVDIIFNKYQEKHLNLRHLFLLVFGDGFEYIFNSIDETIINKNLEIISKSFDVNNDGEIDLDDLEYFKSLDLNKILKIIISINDFINLLNIYNKINISYANRKILIFRIFFYCFFLAFTKNLKEIDKWINNQYDKNLMLDIIQLFDTTIKMSNSIKKTITSNKFKIRNLFCFCIKKTPEQIEKEIFRINEKITNQLYNINYEYLIMKKIKNM